MISISPTAKFLLGAYLLGATISSKIQTAVSAVFKRISCLFTTKCKPQPLQATPKPIQLLTEAEKKAFAEAARLSKEQRALGAAAGKVGLAKANVLAELTKVAALRQGFEALPGCNY